ncbi:MAG: NUDIX hydrolase [Rhodospirillales bacterium]|jgi:8-oxo-dGTP pyrophosphatase MutT (NUDIX family)|nr:NUDIX hydrolase [Rhodospirillales bacterium]
MNRNADVFHPLPPDPVLRIVRPCPALPAEVDAVVERHWQAARDRDPTLFNGDVFSADAIGADGIAGHWTEFRRAVAQMREPGLFATLGIRPTAVGGVLIGDGFVVFGRRPDRAVYQAGEWQLPPAGSLDPGAAQTDATLDWRDQFRRELREELGLPASSLAELRVLGAVEHADSHVCDIGIMARLGVDAAMVRTAHADANGEYEELALVAPGTLPSFLAGRRVTRQTFMFLHQAGLPGG